MLEPVTHRIVVKPVDILEEDDVYKSARKHGIQLIEHQMTREQDAVDVGVVVAFGPTAFQDFHTPNPLAIGDTIVYARYGGKKVEDPVTKEQFLILNDEDVVAILRKDS